MMGDPNVHRITEQNDLEIMWSAKSSLICHALQSCWKLFYNTRNESRRTSVFSYQKVIYFVVTCKTSVEMSANAYFLKAGDSDLDFLYFQKHHSIYESSFSSVHLELQRQLHEIWLTFEVDQNQLAVWPRVCSQRRWLPFSACVCDF